MCEFKNNPKIDQQYFERLNRTLTKMINHCHCNPSLVGFILDTACCYPSQIHLDPIKVTEGKFNLYLNKFKISLLLLYFMYYYRH